MPLSKTHRAGLEQLLKAHANEVADLRAARVTLARRVERRAAGDWDDPHPKPSSVAVLTDQCEFIDRRIERHEQLLVLGRDESVLHTVGELVDHPELVAEAAGDPREYARARGIDLPVTMDIVVRLVDGHPHVSVVNYDQLASFSLVWDREGFQMLR